MKKSHAKEYLSEYTTGKAGWLIALVDRVISANGEPTEQEKEQLFGSLLKENNLESDYSYTPLSEQDLERESNIGEASVSKLTFKKITHVAGVNALMDNQSINFSDSCTVIYGLNGTGKSGYFRVINEITGATKEKDILGNIYTDNKNMKVNIEYFLGDTTHSTTWDNGQRAIVPFTQAKVFDSDYLPIFLNEKESSVNIEPLGLYLFKATTGVIDEFKGKLQNKAEHYKWKVPYIYPLIEGSKSQDLVAILSKNSLSAEDIQCLKKKGVFTATNKGRLGKLTEQKSAIEKDNSSDKVTVLTREISDINNLLSHLNDTKQQINSRIDKVKPAIEHYQSKKKKRDERVKEFEALKNIPEQNSEEWQAFIDSAVEYENQIDKSEFNSDEVCIYCHQPLQEQALNLVKTYSKYLEDQSQREFTDSTQLLDNINTALGNISTDYEFLDDLVRILKTSNNQLKEEVDKYLKSAKEKTQELKGKVKNQDNSKNIFSFDVLDEITSRLNKLIKERQGTIKNLQSSDQERAKKLEKIQRIIDNLSDKKLLSEWLDKVAEHFQFKKLKEKYSGVAETLNTREVTTIASKAYDELLTETIREAFQEELKDLGKDLNVAIRKTKASKGGIRTRLEMKGNNVGKILSEGEQKAVALALFISEIKCQDESFPVIFDDPVTSLDHKIAHALAKKLLLLSKDKQVIIFTHNKLFFNSLIYWSKHLKETDDSKSHHVCKNYSASGCDGTGRHVLTYELQKFSKLETGKVHEAQILSLRYYLDKAKQQIASNEEASQVAASLKSAIEHFIDEKVLLTGLMKDREDSQNMPWKKLSLLQSKNKLLEKLKSHWGNISSRGTHLSYSSSENPLSTEELQEIVNFLEDN